MDLDHVRASAEDKAAASAAVGAAKAVRTRPASAARQANAQEADDADAAYSPGGVHASPFLTCAPHRCACNVSL